jgi:hypothetical protein
VQAERYREPRIERIDPSRYHELDAALGRVSRAAGSQERRPVFDGALHTAEFADVPPVRLPPHASRPTQLNGTGGTAMAWAGAVVTILTLVAYAVGSFS